MRASREYDVTIGEKLLDHCGDALTGLTNAKKAVIITDDNVAPLYLGRVTGSLDRAGIKSLPIIIEHGEGSKNFANAGRLLEECAGFRLTRSDVMLALGGGVVGDLCGFVSAVYLRGVDFVQLPTTILAAVDSSVGGKTAVDLPSGKNLCGAFHQPLAVFCDTDAFATVTPHFYSDGMAEAIKYGVILDPALFKLFSDPAAVRANIDGIVGRCVEIKRDVVERDEFDSGERKLLNFGHTAGHAIEKLSGYSVTHGFAVAAGMSIVSYSSAAAGLSDFAECSELERVLRLYGLPTRADYTAAELAEAAANDKKVEGGDITLIIPKKLGGASLLKLKLSSLEDFFAAGLELMERNPL